MADIFKLLEAAGLPAHRPSETREHSAIKVLIYGEPGSGKTALAGTFPDCLLLDVDGGAQTTLDSAYARKLHLHEKTHYIRVSTVGDVKKALAVLRKDRGRTFKSVAIDTISILSMNKISDLTAATTDAEGSGDSDVEDDRYMEQRDWGKLLLALYRVMKEAVDLGLHLCVTAHVAEREAADGKDMKMPLLQGQFKDMSLAFFDAIGYMYTLYARDPEHSDSGGKPKQIVVHRTQFVATGKVKAKDRTGRLGKYVDDITFEHLQRALVDQETRATEDDEAPLYDDVEHPAVSSREAIAVSAGNESTSEVKAEATEQLKKKKKA